MITTEQLRHWERETKSAYTTALAGIKKYRSVPALHNYYTHIATCADAQLSLVQRLIRQSKVQEAAK